MRVNVNISNNKYTTETWQPPPYTFWKGEEGRAIKWFNATQKTLKLKLLLLLLLENNWEHLLLLHMVKHTAFLLYGTSLLLCVYNHSLVKNYVNHHFSCHTMIFCLIAYHSTHYNYNITRALLFLTLQYNPFCTTLPPLGEKMRECKIGCFPD